MLRYLLCLLFVGFVAGQRTNINGDVDKEMFFHNKNLTERNKGTTYLPSGSYGEFDFSEGEQIGVNTMYRTRDSYRSPNDLDTVYNYQVGYKMLVLDFKNISRKGSPDMVTAANFTIKDNSMDYVFTIHNTTTECKVILNKYKFNTFTDITVSASKPEVLTENFGHDVLMPYYNKILEGKMAKVEHHMQPKCQTQAFSSPDEALNLLYN